MSYFQAVNFLVTAFITTGGFISYNSIIGDFCRTNLGYTDAEFVFGKHFACVIVV